MTARTLPELLVGQNRSPAQWFVRLLALDPGQCHTGWAHFLAGELIEAGEIEASGNEGFSRVADLIEAVKPEVIVCERYRVYPDKALGHTNSELPVAQLIGVIRYVALERGIPIHLQSASQGKFWFDDRRLKALGLYRPGEPHATDAIRHGAHWLVFGKASSPP